MNVTSTAVELYGLILPSFGDTAKGGPKSQEKRAGAFPGLDRMIVSVIDLSRVVVSSRNSNFSSRTWHSLEVWGIGKWQPGIQLDGMDLDQIYKYKYFSGQQLSTRDSNKHC